ncbi:MAG: choline kinase [Alteromonas macleodii]|jgi:choline kinase
MTLVHEHVQTNSKKLIILNAGPPYQGSGGTKEVSLAKAVQGKRTLDWVLMAADLNRSDILIVSGFSTETMKNQFSGVDIFENKDWNTTGSAGSLLSVDLSGIDDLLVCYGDILFRGDIVSRLKGAYADVSVAWDSKFRHRYADRSKADLSRCEKVVERDGSLESLGEGLPTEWASGEFIGLVHFKGSALNLLRAAQEEYLKKTLSGLSLAGLVEWLRIQGQIIQGCDVSGDWAELNEAHDIARFILGTKAESLARLRQVVKTSTIQPQISFSVGEWAEDPDRIISNVRAKFHDTEIIVRSSAKSEDSFLHSNAGAYTSLLNIDHSGNLNSFIEEVCQSYENKQNDDQVLVQPMVPDVVMSGVAFTRTLNLGAPYYVINYTENSETDAITGGKNCDNVTFVIRRDLDADTINENHLKNLLIAIREIESLLDYDALDIEFAIDAHLNIYILQVRPITMLTGGSSMSEDCLRMIEQAEQKWDICDHSRPQIKGSRAVYGMMPDWNPAEIIGTNAGCLAASLYKHLITDDVWAQQRAEYGYKDVRPQPLLVNFCGKSYVDVRASFNSFIPKNVPPNLQTRLVDFYLQRLVENPQFHDKVEFEILPTCYSFGKDIWRSRLLGDPSFQDKDIDILDAGLKRITEHAIEKTSTYMAQALELDTTFEAVRDSVPVSGLERARRLLDECRLKGTLPFAHLARSGFVAMTLLHDAVEKGILSQGAREEFLASIRTVSHEILFDAEKVFEGILPWETFVDTYGHLRPGTYDIQSPAYHENPELYLRPMVKKTAKSVSGTYNISIWDAEKGDFFRLVNSLLTLAEGAEIETFLRAAIEGREKSKFIFTRYLSEALKEIQDWGLIVGITREELSHLNIHDLLELCDTPNALTGQIKRLRKKASKAAHAAQVSAACQLPELLTSSMDFKMFRMRAGQPNFIGTGVIQAACVVLGRDPSTSNRTKSNFLEGCIVMIPQADPGYDWLFGQDIVGLVTMYGGANSHMAIRAAEFGLPAAIGVGEKIYQSLTDARIIELNPLNKILRAVG